MNIKYRILGAIAVATFGSLVIAGNEQNLSPEQYCERYDDTSLVMELRQASFDSKKGEVQAIASSHYQGSLEILTAIVDEAFKTPYQPYVANKKKAIADFESKGYEICLTKKNNI
tara:strand:- start:808 stop:1152 length:345 start_codon:yes stop_codon:yes gene_type:complete